MYCVFKYNFIYLKLLKNIKLIFFQIKNIFKKTPKKQKQKHSQTTPKIKTQIAMVALKVLSSIYIHQYPCHKGGLSTSN